MFDELVNELYTLVNRKKNNETLSDNEVARYLELVDILHKNNIEIPIADIV